jgi:hypothetical protein
MSDHGIRVEQHRIVIRNRSVAALHIANGLVQLAGLILLFNVRFDSPVLIVVGALVGVPKAMSWRRKWRRRMEFDAAGITVVNFWSRHTFPWAQVTQFQIQTGFPLLGASTRGAVLVITASGDVARAGAAASMSVGRRRRHRLAEVLRTNPLIVRRPPAELASLAEQLLAWDTKTNASARLDRVEAARQRATGTTGARRLAFVMLALALACTALTVGALWYLLNPVFDNEPRKTASRDIDGRALLGREGPCDGELVPPQPFNLSTPLQTVVLRSGAGKDIWKVHAKFEMAWNFAQHVSLQAIDGSTGYVHDMPGGLATPLLGGYALTLVIGDGNREVQISCDGPPAGSRNTSP